MTQEIICIDLGGVNCFLVKTSTGFILIDTGFVGKRAALDKALENAGCRQGNLHFVILTHGDSDHADNAAYLQKKFGARIAIHVDDAGMVERGDMTWNRKNKPDRIALFARIMSKVAPLFVKGSKFEVFKPDVLINEDISLIEFGLDAKTIHLPGHSKGSIGILTASNDLFCGDLIYNILGKLVCPYVDDLYSYNASLDKLRLLNLYFPVNDEHEMNGSEPGKPEL